MPPPAVDASINAAERPVRVLPPPHARYQGRHLPEHKYDVTAGKDMPAWSTSLFAFRDNVQMTLCAMTGVGVCVIHGHVQDALYGSGCCLSCLIAFFTLGEFGRQRSFFRKRLEMPGGEYVCSGVFGDFFEVLFCFPLTACQEARELEIRSMRRWHPLRGFRGKGEHFLVPYCGEETTRNVLAAYKPKPKDVLREGLYDNEKEDDAMSDASGGMLRPPARIDYMSR